MTLTHDHCVVCDVRLDSEDRIEVWDEITVNDPDARGSVGIVSMTYCKEHAP